MGEYRGSNRPWEKGSSWAMFSFKEKELRGPEGMRGFGKRLQRAKRDEMVHRLLCFPSTYTPPPSYLLHPYLCPIFGPCGPEW